MFYKVISFRDVPCLKHLPLNYFDDIKKVLLVDWGNPLKMSADHSNTMPVAEAEIVTLDIPVSFLYHKKKTQGPIGNILRKINPNYVAQRVVNELSVKFPNNKILLSYCHDHALNILCPKNVFIISTNIDNRKYQKHHHIAAPYFINDDRSLREMKLEVTVYDKKKYTYGFLGQSNLYRKDILSVLNKRSDTILEITDVWWKNHESSVRWDNLRRHMVDFYSSVQYPIVPEGAGYHVSKLNEAYILSKKPVIVSPYLLMPFENEINWSDYAFNYKERVEPHNIDNFTNFLDKVKNESYDTADISRFYDSYLHPNAYFDRTELMIKDVLNKKSV